MNTRDLMATCGTLMLLLLMTSMNHCRRKTKGASPILHTVIIKKMMFSPDTLSVRQGDTVLFLNQDIVSHDATEISKDWFSPPLKTGDSWKWIAEKSANYYCSIHLVMKGKIIVDESFHDE